MSGSVELLSAKRASCAACFWFRSPVPVGEFSVMLSRFAVALATLVGVVALAEPSAGAGLVGRSEAAVR